MTNLHLGAMSLHLDNDYDYNQSNKLIMVEHESYVAGGFVNSFNDFSFIAGKAFEWESQYIDYGVIVGGVTGYEYDFTYKGITPMIAPYVTLKGLPVEPVVSLFGNAITFSVRVEL